MDNDESNKFRQMLLRSPLVESTDPKKASSKKKKTKKKTVKKKTKRKNKQTKKKKPQRRKHIKGLKYLDEYTPMEDFKYFRTGHVNIGRHADVLVDHLRYLLPGTGELPQRWMYKNREKFLAKYLDDLGPVMWANTASYNMLLIDGKYIFRFWTDVASHCLVDVSNELAVELSSHFKVEDIPVSTYTKSKPFTKRIDISTKQEVEILVLQTLVTYGVV